MRDVLNDILEHLEIEDLAGDTYMIAELAGLDTAKRLLTYCDGLVLTIQRVKNIDRLLIKYLKNKYTEDNYSKRDVLKIAKDINRSPRETQRLLSERNK